MSKEYKNNEVSWKSYEIGGMGESPIFGVDISLGYLKFESEYGQWNDATIVEASAGVEASAVDLEVSGSYGAISCEAEAQLISGEAGMSGKVKLMEDGVFAPQITAEAEAEATFAQGGIGAAIGNEYIDVHTNAEGEFIHAEAEAGIGAGEITYKDEDGNTKTVTGVYAGAGAEAYIAKGSIGGGINILGIVIDVSAEGKIGGVGASANVGFYVDRLEAGLGLGCLAGLGLDVSIDWSDFKWPDFDGEDENGKEGDKYKTAVFDGNGERRFVIYPKKIKKEATVLQAVSKEILQLSLQIDNVEKNLQMGGFQHFL